METRIIKFTSFRGYETSSTCNCERFSWENRVHSCKSQTKHQTAYVIQDEPLLVIKWPYITPIHVQFVSPTSGCQCHWQTRGSTCSLLAFLIGLCDLWEVRNCWGKLRFSTPVVGNRVKIHATSLPVAHNPI